MSPAEYEFAAEDSGLEGTEGLPPTQGMAPQLGPRVAPHIEAPGALQGGFVQQQAALRRGSVVSGGEGYSVHPDLIRQAQMGHLQGYGGYGADAPASSSDPSTLETYSPVPAENGNSLGLSLLILTIGGGVGMKYGGALGSVAGGLYGGTLVNLIRAGRCVVKGNKASDKEAMISASYAILGGAVATYLVFRQVKGKKKGSSAGGATLTKNGDDSDDSEDSE